MDGFTIPTILFGTTQGARSSAILRQSSGLAELPGSEARILGAFPLALAKWLRQREVDEAIGCLPLGYQPTTGRLLFHCVYLNDLGNEPVGIASGIYLGPQVLAALDFHPERLLHLLPTPGKQEAVGNDPLHVRQSDFRPPEPGVATGLEWRNIAVEVPPAVDPLNPLVQVLAAVRDPRRQARVMGWATSSRFARVGAFNPELAFQLIVSPTPPLEGAYHQMAWHDGTIAGSPVPVPASWDQWQQIDAAVADDAALRAACAWSPLFIEMDPAAVVARLEERLLGDGAAGAALYLAFLLRLQAAGLVQDAEARLLRAIDNPDTRPDLLGAVFDLAEDFKSRLGVADLFERVPTITLDLPPDRFARLLNDSDWLLRPELLKRHIEQMTDDQLTVALSAAVARVEGTEGRKNAEYKNALRRLLIEFIENSRNGAQQGPAAYDLVDRLDRKGRALLPPDLRQRFITIRDHVLRYLGPDQTGPGTVAAAARPDLPSHFPRTQDELDQLMYALTMVRPHPRPALPTRRRGAPADGPLPTVRHPAD